MIVSTLYIDTAATLTIDPGVVVRANPGVSIRNQGILNAVGTAEAGITFTKNGTTKWNGIILASAISRRNFTFAHCTIEYANTGLDDVGPFSSTGPVTHSILRNNTVGINGRQGMSLGSTQFIANTTHGLNSNGMPVFTDADVVFDGCGTGINIYGSGEE